MSDDAVPVRQMWQVLEPLHAVVYYAPQVADECAALGYVTAERWPTYFPLRAAPLGEADTALVAATFHSFSPEMVAQHVPTAWTTASADAVLAARRRGVDRAYRAVFGDRVDGVEMAQAAKLARRAAEAVDVAGRPLGAANADLPWPDEPHLQLWHATTVLREARGDGHVAALLAAGLDACESLVSFAAVGAAPVEVFASRGWSQQQWAAARDRLVLRGWLDPTGVATDRGHAARRDVERTTDRLAAAPWHALGPEDAGHLAQLVLPLVQAVLETGWLPSRNTLGIGRVAA